jgi:hypothetical protein
MSKHMRELLPDPLEIDTLLASGFQDFMQP